MSKKILSVVLALVFIISTFAVSAFAIEGTRGEDEGATYKQTWVLENDGDADGDGVWTVYVKLTTTYKVGAMQFVVNNPNDKVKLTSAVLGDDVPADYGAELTPNLDTGKMVIVPEPVDGTEAEELSNAIVAVLTYSVPAGESTTLTIDASEAKTESNIAGTLVALRMADEYLESGDMIFGQVVDATAAKTQLGSASVAPTLVVRDGEIGVIDTTRTELEIDADLNVISTCDGYVYGVDAFVKENSSVEDIFAVEGDGEIVVTPSPAGEELGTGAMVNVVDLDGNVVASYVLIIFGDVDGDGYPTPSDASDIELHDATSIPNETGILHPYQAFAGDIDCDGYPTPSDASDVILHDSTSIPNGVGFILVDDIIAML